VAFAGFDVDFVPPLQTNQATSSDVLKVVEIDSEEDERKDEDKDAEREVSYSADIVGRRETHKFLMKRTPKRYMSRLPVIRARVSQNVVRSAARVQYLSGTPGSRVR
jgi:hypothetical protein